MKTIKQWLKECLSEEDYDKAKKYQNEDWFLEVESFKDALFYAFTWYETEEAHDYWNKIHENGGSQNTDPIVEAVCEDLKMRSKLGIKKYGTTLKDANLSDKELLQHAYEEALDLANYLKTLITKQDDRTN